MRRIFLANAGIEEARAFQQMIAACWGENAELCTTGRGLLEKLRWSPEALVLIFTENGDFHRLTRQVRIVSAMARVVWLGSGGNQTDIEGVNAGIDGYLHLPCSPEALENLAACIRQRELVEQNENRLEQEELRLSSELTDRAEQADSAGENL